MLKGKVGSKEKDKQEKKKEEMFCSGLAKFCCIYSGYENCNVAIVTEYNSVQVTFSLPPPSNPLPKTNK